MVLAHKVQEEERTRDIQISVDVTFSSMLLSNNTLEGLNNSGFYKPSPIQLHGIPLGKCGFDLILEAKSGTGKTAVFTVIALEQLQLNKGLQSVILAPTREIATQVGDVIKQIGSSYDGLNVEVVIGGLSVADDIEKFQKNVHILVGSPGRLRYLIQDNNIDVSAVRLLVLDEADKLIDKSFQSDINYIFSALPKQKQVILSSATYPDISIMQNYVKNAQHICPNSTSILIGIKQVVTVVESNVNIVSQTKNKFDELLKILAKHEFKQCLIFCNYQVRVGELCKMLKREKWPAELLHGQLEQTDRLDALKTLQEYKCRILVSTDLAARGIDASNVDLVINFEPPFEWQTYLHRIGRAGRFGSYGIAITILSKGKEHSKFKEMMKSIGTSINMHYLWNDDIFKLDNNNLSDSLQKSIEVNELNTSKLKDKPMQTKTTEKKEMHKVSSITAGNKAQGANTVQEITGKEIKCQKLAHSSKCVSEDMETQCRSENSDNDSPFLNEVNYKRSTITGKKTQGNETFERPYDYPTTEIDNRIPHKSEEEDTGDELLDILKYEQINSKNEIQTLLNISDSLEEPRFKIESFDDLMTSFKQFEPIHNENIEFNDLICKSKLNNVLNDAVNSNIIKKSNNVSECEEAQHESDKQSVVNLISDHIENKHTSRTNTEGHTNNNTDQYQNQVEATLDSSQKALKDAGLPISFASTKYCNREPANKVKPFNGSDNVSNKQKSNKNRYKNNNCQSIGNKVREINLRNSTEASTSLDDDGYNTHSGLSRSTKYISFQNSKKYANCSKIVYKCTNTGLHKLAAGSDTYSQYKAWYKQLKTHIQQVEKSLYIDELSKA